MHAVSQTVKLPFGVRLKLVKQVCSICQGSKYLPEDVASNQERAREALHRVRWLIPEWTLQRSKPSGG